MRLISIHFVSTTAGDYLQVYREPFTIGRALLLLGTRIFYWSHAADNASPMRTLVTGSGRLHRTIVDDFLGEAAFVTIKSGATPWYEVG